MSKTYRYNTEAPSEAARLRRLAVELARKRDQRRMAREAYIWAEELTSRTQEVQA